MFGCQCMCLFCKVLCDQTIEGHPGNHSIRLHRILCLTGYLNEDTQSLTCDVCTFLVAGNREFKNQDTNWKKCRYKGYQPVNDYYKSWTMPLDPSFEVSKYWQRRMVKFSKELAEYHRQKNHTSLLLGKM